MGIIERKEREKEQRRKDIILAAEKVFHSKGFDRSTMDDVAEEAELSKGTLYLYFKSKVEIHWAITEKGLSLLSDRMTETISSDRTGIENLFELGDVFYRFSEEQPVYFNSILFFEGKDLEKLEFGDIIMENWFKGSPIEKLYEVVEAGMKDGTVRDDLPVSTMANTLWAQMLGVLQVIRNKREVFEMLNITPGELIRCHYELLMNGIKTKGFVS
ncbi:MAG: TetR/AcrR family transcriptional regulator [Bacteroidales bacterium]|nr:MAG: TetR/AcrR family transcriptional regulator [Bacteroidales bacterium]